MALVLDTCEMAPVDAICALYWHVMVAVAASDGTSNGSWPLSHSHTHPARHHLCAYSNILSCWHVTCCCRLNEIRVLKVRLADMRRELHVLRTGVANVDVLKREVRPNTVSGCHCK